MLRNGVLGYRRFEAEYCFVVKGADIRELSLSLSISLFFFLIHLGRFTRTAGATFLIHTAAIPLNSHVIIFFRDQGAPQLSMSLPCKTGHNGGVRGVGMLLSSGVDVSA